MKEERFLKNNKLIAEFMTDEPEVLKRDLQKAGTLESMHYYDEWDWLMPVVTKIDSLGYEVLIGRISCNINEILNRENPIVSMVCGNITEKIGLIYETVVKFIKWYNENK